MSVSLALVSGLERLGDRLNPIVVKEEIGRAHV